MNAVTDFIKAQPEELKPIFEALRKLILNASPDIMEEIKWYVPVFSYKGLLCYLNGKKTYVHLGICKGTKLSNKQGILEGDAKVVRLIPINSVEEMNEEIIMEVLQEALLINELSESMGIKPSYRL
ncbi:MAG: hypothetical protein COC01_03500 [Bacteroidetes bacterium]|nr:DUF1801 domain-containing protein [Bacteroidia bacterium]PCH68568.1 MAG: hypothetical protein COC01_03500 [Bacteroidota bacterium]